jgi:hypothetical protein
MDLSDLLGKDAVIAGLKAKSKKQAIQELSAKAAELTGKSSIRFFSVSAWAPREWATALRSPTAS